MNSDSVNHFFNFFIDKIEIGVYNDIRVPPRVLYLFHKGIPIRDSIDKCPKESILMWPPKWFTMISSNFPAMAYRIYRVPPLTACMVHSKFLIRLYFMDIIIISISYTYKYFNRDY